jgi:Na+/H+-dicarboxylate symporter
MPRHWLILAWMLAGIAVGGLLQLIEATATSGLTVRAADGGIEVTAASDTAAGATLVPGTRIWSAVLRKGQPDEETRKIAAPEDLAAAVAASAVGDVLWIGKGPTRERLELVPLSLDMAPDAPRRTWLEPFLFLKDIFLALLKMLIVPLVLTSIIAGVSGVGATRDLRRLGVKTILFYVSTSMLAIFTGLALVNLIRPGDGARLGLPFSDEFGERRTESFWDIFLRMVPPNLFDALRDNGAMLQIIFFGLIFGYCITRAPEPHKGRMQQFFESAFDVMLRVAMLVLALLPYGVFCLLVAVVGTTGFGLFGPLGLYMLMIVGGLAFHALVVLPLILRFVGGVSPLQWAKTMSPALMTAFSASSSSMTLPVTLECVEHSGKVSNKVSSFVLPLGATINMDGTALYECAGVIFLSQYYASIGGTPLGFGDQMFVVVLALFASIGAAGIPSAGLVMMLTILSALDLPLEGAALLLAVDRPLDMLRTMVNVWSDSTGAAVIARTEGELLPAMVARR